MPSQGVRRSTRLAQHRAESPSAKDSLEDAPVLVEDAVTETPDTVADDAPARRPSKRAKATVQEDGDAVEAPKAKRKKRVVEEPVYVIPDVETKTTTFRGRLGV